MDKIKRGDSQSRDYYGILGHLGAALYDLTQDEQYITDIVESVREDPCSAFDNVMRLFRVPTSIATIDSAWRRLGREGDQSTRDLCLEYLDRRLDDPMMKEYIQTLPVNEGRDMMRAVTEYRARIRERMARQQDLDMLVHSYVESGMSIQQALDLIRKSRR